MQFDQNKYLETLLQYYEEEIMGEAYFNALVVEFPDDHQKKKMMLLAAIERVAANSVFPLIQKYNLNPRSDKELHMLGCKDVSEVLKDDWGAFIFHMVERYPEYIPEFQALENMAPKEDQEYLKVLTEHEIAVIKFARMEQSGDVDSIKPLQAYLEGRIIVT